MPTVTTATAAAAISDADASMPTGEEACFAEAEADFGAASCCAALAALADLADLAADLVLDDLAALVALPAWLCLA